MGPGGAGALAVQQQNWQNASTDGRQIESATEKAICAAQTQQRRTEVRLCSAEGQRILAECSSLTRGWRGVRVVGAEGLEPPTYAL
jgi:hypothetical protein